VTCGFSLRSAVHACNFFVHIFLCYQADVNLRLPNGKTPLDLAVNADNSASHMMKLLLQQVSPSFPLPPSFALSLPSLPTPYADRHHTRTQQEADGTVERRRVKTLNKALLKFSRAKGSHSSIPGHEGSSQPPLKRASGPKWRHLKAQQVNVFANTLFLP